MEEFNTSEKIIQAMENVKMISNEIFNFKQNHQPATERDKVEMITTIDALCSALFKTYEAIQPFEESFAGRVKILSVIVQAISLRQDYE